MQFFKSSINRKIYGFSNYCYYCCCHYHYFYHYYYHPWRYLVSFLGIWSILLCVHWKTYAVRLGKKTNFKITKCTWGIHLWKTKLNIKAWTMGRLGYMEGCFKQSPRWSAKIICLIHVILSLKGQIKLCWKHSGYFKWLVTQNGLLGVALKRVSSAGFVVFCPVIIFRGK